MHPYNTVNTVQKYFYIVIGYTVVASDLLGRISTLIKCFLQVKFDVRSIPNCIVFLLKICAKNKYPRYYLRVLFSDWMCSVFNDKNNARLDTVSRYIIIRFCPEPTKLYFIIFIWLCQFTFTIVAVKLICSGNTLHNERFNFDTKKKYITYVTQHMGWIVPGLMK